jgi:hypothetical protein
MPLRPRTVALSVAIAVHLHQSLPASQMYCWQRFVQPKLAAHALACSANMPLTPACSGPLVTGSRKLQYAMMNTMTRAWINRRAMHTHCFSSSVKPRFDEQRFFRWLLSKCPLGQVQVTMSFGYFVL